MKALSKTEDPSDSRECRMQSILRVQMMGFIGYNPMQHTITAHLGNVISRR